MRIAVLRGGPGNGGPCVWRLSPDQSVDKMAVRPRAKGEISAQMDQNLSEHRVAPRAVVVHDPTRWGALAVFDGDMARTRRQLLFQDVPEPEAYRADLAFFHATLEALVGEVLYLDQVIDGAVNAAHLAANPNHVFARDSAVTLPWAPGRYIACNMARPIRRQEPRVMARALESLGLRPLIALPAERHLEGGDVIPFSYDGKRCLLMGHGPRTDRATVAYLAKHLIPDWLDEIIAIRLSPRRINLDGAFCPVDAGVVIANLESLLDARRYDARGGRDVELRQVIGETGLRPIEVGFADSRARQACNCFCAGNRRVIMYDLCPQVAEAVAKAGLAVTVVPGAELVKGNGGPRCMTRPLYG